MMTAASRRALECEVGYSICGINGCILADRHGGDCVFPFIESKGSRRRASTSPAKVVCPPPKVPSPKKKKVDEEVCGKCGEADWEPGN